MHVLSASTRTEYNDVYLCLAKTLTELDSVETREITPAIKTFFEQRYAPLYVAGANGCKEFLFDLAVLSCDPRALYLNDQPEHKLHVAIESELGGTSASASKAALHNVIVDFIKLLYANAEQKILIAAYSIAHKYAHDPDGEFRKIIARLEDINNKSNNDTPILCVFVRGDHTSGNSRQLKICRPIHTRGVILHKHSEPINLPLQLA